MKLVFKKFIIGNEIPSENLVKASFKIPLFNHDSNYGRMRIGNNIVNSHSIALKNIAMPLQKAAFSIVNKFGKL